ncbi:hypothetical protein VNO78_15397 [Psophocarpus tetragonolobus]|uniref:Uncharacterized protein n=1 Tax=Psophocarpus tetragonolobus TaxID=3891 RepID=A0AAN9XJV0_PSOTE
MCKGFLATVGAVLATKRKRSEEGTRVAWGTYAKGKVVTNRCGMGSSCVGSNVEMDFDGQMIDNDSIWDIEKTITVTKSANQVTLDLTIFDCAQEVSEGRLKFGLGHEDVLGSLVIMGREQVIHITFNKWHVDRGVSQLEVTAIDTQNSWVLISQKPERKEWHEAIIHKHSKPLLYMEVVLNVTLSGEPTSYAHFMPPWSGVLAQPYGVPSHFYGVDEQYDSEDHGLLGDVVCVVLEVEGKKGRISGEEEGLVEVSVNFVPKD